jgi:AraC family transcriptional regulator, regulatory protein of adaptative response / methylated-DNA-[protein]-cysteine methyltransferase
VIDDKPEALVRDLQDRFSNARLIGGDIDYESLVTRVVGFIEARGLGLELPLDVRCSVFQQLVWQALREIPTNQTVTCTDIARKVGSIKLVRALRGFLINGVDERLDVPVFD